MITILNNQENSTKNRSTLRFIFSELVFMKGCGGGQHADGLVSSSGNLFLARADKTIACCFGLKGKG